MRWLCAFLVIFGRRSKSGRGSRVAMAACWREAEQAPRVHDAENRRFSGTEGTLYLLFRVRLFSFVAHRAGRVALKRLCR